MEIQQQETVKLQINEIVQAAALSNANVYPAFEGDESLQRIFDQQQRQMMRMFLRQKIDELQDLGALSRLAHAAQLEYEKLQKEAD